MYVYILVGLQKLESLRFKAVDVEDVASLFNVTIMERYLNEVSPSNEKDYVERSKRRVMIKTDLESQCMDILSTDISLHQDQSMIQRIQSLKEYLDNHVTCVYEFDITSEVLHEDRTSISHILGSR